MSYPSYESSQPTYGGYQSDQSERTNTLAIISLVSAFFVSLAAIITGHIALVQIRRTGERGRGLAIAGLILGYIGLLLGSLALIASIVLPLTLSKHYAEREAAVTNDVRNTVTLVVTAQFNEQPLSTVQPVQSLGDQVVITQSADGNSFTVRGTGEGTQPGFHADYESLTGRFSTSFN